MPVALPALGVIAAFCVLIALSYAYKASIGALLSALADAAERVIPRVPVIHYDLGAHIASWLRGVDNAIRDALAAGIHGTEWAWHQMVHFVAHQFQSIGHTTNEVAGATDSALSYLRKHGIPLAIGLKLLPINAVLSWLVPLVKSLSKEVTHLIEHPTRPLVKVIHEQAAVAQALPTIIFRTLPQTITKAVAVPGSVVRGIDETLKETVARLNRLARILTPAGILGLVGAAVFAHFGLGWLKCSNVNKVGKKVCGMDHNVLEGLLAGLLALFGTFSLVEFGKFLIPVVGEIGGETTKFWRAEIAHEAADRAIGSAKLNAL